MRVQMGFFLWMMLAANVVIVTAQSGGGGYHCFPAFFAFGDDWADTGNARTLYPIDFEAEEDADPYGMTFFQGPAHRLSDGRLMIDFLAQAFGMPFLSSYAIGVASNLRHGVSFAVAGSTGSLFNLVVPYPLMLQAEWLHKFHSDVLDAIATGTTQPLPEATSFERALYVVSTGQNDYRYALLHQRLTVTEVEFNIAPYVVANITTTIGILAADVRASKFMIINLPPLGCTPEILTIFASINIQDYDDKGCLIEYNRISQLHNELLFAAVDRLRAATAYNITYVDMYEIMTAVMYDPQLNGFGEALMACCGKEEEPYNFDGKMMCGEHNGMMNVSVCSVPEDYVSWDGIHVTESFNRFAVEKILAGNFITPAQEMTCQLPLEDRPPQHRKPHH